MLKLLAIDDEIEFTNLIMNYFSLRGFKVLVAADGDQGLAMALAEGRSVTQFLRTAMGTPWVSSLDDFFAFFALVTSFLGMALGLFDFLRDGLKIARGRRGNVLLGLLVAAPILLIVFTIERVFLLALDSSGGIGDAILNGLFPALMLWVGRYHRREVSELRVPGGKPLIVMIIGYACFVFAVEILGKFGVISTL